MSRPDPDPNTTSYPSLPCPPGLGLKCDVCGAPAVSRANDVEEVASKDGLFRRLVTARRLFCAAHDRPGTFTPYRKPEGA